MALAQTGAVSEYYDPEGRPITLEEWGQLLRSAARIQIRPGGRSKRTLETFEFRLYGWA